MHYYTGFKWMRLALMAFFLAARFAHGAENRILAEWMFDQDLRGWAPNGQITEIRVGEGALSCRTVGDDPIFELQSPLEFAATPRQYIDVRLKADHSGMAEFFWSNTKQGQYDGFSGEKHTQFNVVGDGQWHDYRIFPFWQSEGKIIRMRFDLFGASRFSIQHIRIAELPSADIASNATFEFSKGLGAWQTAGSISVTNNIGGLRVVSGSPDAFLLGPPIAEKAADKSFVAIRMSSSLGKKARLIFATDKIAGMHSLNFATVPDGKEHIYNLDMLASPDWRDTIVALGVQLGEEHGASAVLHSLAVVAEPQGPPQLSVINFALDDASPRIGVPARILARISNSGGGVASSLDARLEVPEGVRIVASPKQEEVFARLGYSEEAVLSWTVECSQQTVGMARLVLSAANAESVTNQTTISFCKGPELAKAAYVPEPKPVRGKYDVGAYYFPGWQSRSQWQPIERFPERKPVLGWYREGDPEVADWHIKWAVEHGITFFAYDWYWTRGARQLEHGLHDGFFKARYKSMLKFCLLWANHNPPKTHSVEDSQAVARYWIANYFQRPEYYRIDGKPVVIIFSPYNYRSDMGVSGVNEAFEAMREECRKAGLPGLYLAACVGNARQVDGQNYDAVTAYNWPSLGVSGSENQVPFDSLIPAYRQQWSQLLSEDTRPILLPLCGGWDSRPWHGDAALVRTGRNPKLFKQHLRDARQFLEANAANARVLPSVLVEAWNEWGEGSYIEPHKEFGFGYLDAIREVFTDAPASHEDLAPVDAGLGPYDLPASDVAKTAWTFAQDSADWKNTMGLDQVTVGGGMLQAVSVGNDPAFFSPPIQARANEFSRVHVRMRLSRADGKNAHDLAQLFWSSKRWPESEASSLRFPVTIDGQWHDYDLTVKDNARWKGIITRLRLDPVNQGGVRVEIREIGLKSIESASAVDSNTAAKLTLTGDWQLSVTDARLGSNVTVQIERPAVCVVEAERFDRLPPYNAGAGGWTKGARLRGVIAQECTTPGLLDPASLVLRGGPSSDAPLFEAGKDYGVDLSWGTIGRLPEGRITQDQPVFASYRHGQLRIDSLAIDAAGGLVVRKGEPRAAAPRPPKLETGDKLLANIWLPGAIAKLTQDHLFPILESSYPVPPKPKPTVAEALLPKTIAKLRQGTPLRILAWGDSVTDGSFLPQGLGARWQEQFVTQLRSRYPKAKIELVTEAWGGRNTESYLQEPPGSPHNYKEKVLGAKADLIVSEFVNDAGLNPEQVEARYSRLLADLKAVSAEWIVLTPHYVRPDWMGLVKERDCDEDPRPYVKGLRQFATKHGIPLADASLRYGRLWRQGIPYNSLMLNSINHPDDRGMKLFADAIMELFP